MHFLRLVQSEKTTHSSFSSRATTRLSFLGNFTTIESMNDVESHNVSIILSGHPSNDVATSEKKLLTVEALENYPDLNMIKLPELNTIHCYF